MAPRHITLVSLILLVAALALIMHTDELGIWADENWSVSHADQSLTQLLAERDVTWLPTYFVVHLTVYQWRDGQCLPSDRDAEPNQTIIIDKAHVLSFAVWETLPCERTGMP